MPKPPKGQGCKKVTNPCKICLQEVNHKNGVQCQGACEAWVHFECLNYTPGKIKDIKDGFITVTCPCPDCKTTVPKEYRSLEPFTCNNVMCPANNPPSCEEFDCQANELSRCMPPRCPPPGTLRTCAARLCRDYSSPTSFKANANDPCMEGYTINTYCDEKGTPIQRNSVPASCNPAPNPMVPLVKQPVGMPGQGMPGQGMPGQGMPGQQMSPEIVQQMCKTVGDLTQQLTCLIDNLKGMGLERGELGGCPPAQQGMLPCGSSGSNCGGKAGCKKCSSGGSGGRGGGGGGGGQCAPPPRGGKKSGCTGGCGTAGQSSCAQPCHCPGNPVQKHR